MLLKELKRIVLNFLKPFEDNRIELYDLYCISDILTEDQLIVNLSGNGRGIL